MRDVKERGGLFLTDSQEKRNREETNFEVERRKMERIHTSSV